MVTIPRRSRALALVVVLASLLPCVAGAAPAPAPTLAVGVSQVQGESWFGGLAVDGAGNVYVPAVIRGPGVVDFGNGVTAQDANPKSWNAVLVKYGADGKALWARSVGGAPTDSEFREAAVDGVGNVYVIGYVGKGTFDFGNGVTATGVYPYIGLEDDRRGNMILVKFDFTGRALWARTVVSCTDSSAFRGLAVDAAGNAYCAGVISRGVFDLGDGAAVTAGADTDGSGVLAKYDPSGRVIWARTVPTRPTRKWHVSFHDVALHPAGGVMVAGSIGNQAFDFGDGVKTPGGIVGEFHGLLARYDGDGRARWVHVAPFGVGSYFAVAVDPSGYASVAGQLSNSVTARFSSDVSIRSTSSSYGQMMVARYDASGSIQWARTVAEGAYFSTAASVDVDADGNVFVGGMIYRNGGYDFGAGVVARGPYASSSASSSGRLWGANALIVKYDREGTAQWAWTVAASACDTGISDVTRGPDGAMYAAASMQDGTVTFAPGVTASARGLWTNGVLLKF